VKTKLPAHFNVWLVASKTGTQVMTSQIASHPTNKGVVSPEACVEFMFRTWWANAEKDLLPSFEFIYAETPDGKTRSKLWRTADLLAYVQDNPPKETNDA
jgi:hypothetical protein